MPGPASTQRPGAAVPGRARPSQGFRGAVMVHLALRDLVSMSMRLITIDGLRRRPPCAGLHGPDPPTPSLRGSCGDTYGPLEPTVFDEEAFGRPTRMR